jgi:hypothetical protein
MSEVHFDGLRKQARTSTIGGSCVTIKEPYEYPPRISVMGSEGMLCTQPTGDSAELSLTRICGVWSWLI